MFCCNYKLDQNSIKLQLGVKSQWGKLWSDVSEPDLLKVWTTITSTFSACGCFGCLAQISFCGTISVSSPLVVVPWVVWVFAVNVCFLWPPFYCVCVSFIAQRRGRRHAWFASKEVLPQGALCMYANPSHLHPACAHLKDDLINSGILSYFRVLRFPFKFCVCLCWCFHPADCWHFKRSSSSSLSHTFKTFVLSV